jgi:hypothetical protein
LVIQPFRVVAIEIPNHSEQENSNESGGPTIITPIEREEKNAHNAECHQTEHSDIHPVYLLVVGMPVLREFNDIACFPLKFFGLVDHCQPPVSPMIRRIGLPLVSQKDLPV